MGGSEGGGGGEMNINYKEKLKLESLYRVFEILYYYLTYFSIPIGFSKDNRVIFILNSFVFRFTTYLITNDKYLKNRILVRVYDSKHNSTESFKSNYCNDDFDRCISFWGLRKIKFMDVCCGTNSLSKMVIFR